MTPLFGIVVVALLSGVQAQPPYTQTDDSNNYIRPTSTTGLPTNTPVLVYQGSAPEQVHVSLGPVGYVYITWVAGPDGKETGILGSCSSPKPVSGSVVKYGTSNSALTSTSTVVSAQTYQQSAALPSYLTSYCSGVIYTATVGPLLPSKTYYYQVGDPTNGYTPASGQSPFSFTMPPAPGFSGMFPYTFTMCADLGQTYNSSTTLAGMKAENNPMTVLWGDLSYADDYNTDQRNGYQPRWDTWGRFTQANFANSIFMSLVGNHEIEPEIIPPRTFKSYETRYPAPYQSAGSSSPQYYSFNAGGAHFIMLSTYSDSLPISDQYAFLVKDLAAYNRALTPWLIVGFHEPWYTSTQEQYVEAFFMQDNFESLMFQYGVDMVFTGHVHAYERTFTTYKNQINTCGPTYFVIGDGGNEEGLSTGYINPQPSWSAYREPSFGFGLLTLIDANTAYWAWHRNQDGLPVAADTATITRATSCQNHGGSVGANVVGSVTNLATSPAAQLTNSTAKSYSGRRRN